MKFLISVAIGAAAIAASPPALTDERCAAILPIVQELLEITTSFETDTAPLLAQLPELRFERSRGFGTTQIDLPEDAQRAFHDFENEASSAFRSVIPEYAARLRMLARELEACS